MGIPAGTVCGHVITVTTKAISCISDIGIVWKCTESGKMWSREAAAGKASKSAGLRVTPGG
jgi:hypothetical protein